VCSSPATQLMIMITIHVQRPTSEVTSVASAMRSGISAPVPNLYSRAITPCSIITSTSQLPPVAIYEFRCEDVWCRSARATNIVHFGHPQRCLPLSITVTCEKKIRTLQIAYSVSHLKRPNSMIFTPHLHVL